MKVNYYFVLMSQTTFVENMNAEQVIMYVTRIDPNDLKIY